MCSRRRAASPEAGGSLVTLRDGSEKGTSATLQVRLQGAAGTKGREGGGDDMTAQLLGGGNVYEGGTGCREQQVRARRRRRRAVWRQIAGGQGLGGARQHLAVEQLPAKGGHTPTGGVEGGGDGTAARRAPSHRGVDIGVEEEQTATLAHIQGAEAGGIEWFSRRISGTDGALTAKTGTA